MGFSFLPITWKGWASIGVFLLIEALLALVTAEAGSLMWWLVAAIGFGLFLGFWAFCLWNTEES